MDTTEAYLQQQQRSKARRGFSQKVYLTEFFIIITILLGAGGVIILASKGEQKSELLESGQWKSVEIVQKTLRGTGS